jgi:predicted dehydrogenase
MEHQIRNWFHFLWLSGDYVQEQACHTLDKIAWAMRDVPPLSVSAVGGRELREHGNNYDHFTATFDYPDEVKAFLMTRQMNGCAYDNNDWVMGEKGVATVKNWEPRHEITGENPWVYEGEGNEMYQQEHDELFASIRAGTPINDGIYMAHSTLMGIMVRMSAYTGQVVSWEEALNSEERLGPESYALGPVEVQEPAVPGRVLAPVPEPAVEEAPSKAQEEE